MKYKYARDITEKKIDPKEEEKKDNVKFWEKEIKDQYTKAVTAEKDGDDKEVDRRKAKIKVLKKMMTRRFPSSLKQEEE